MNTHPAIIALRAEIAANGCNPTARKVGLCASTVDNLNAGTCNSPKILQQLNRRLLGVDLISPTDGTARDILQWWCDCRTAKEMADHFGVDRSTVPKWCRGEYKMPFWMVDYINASLRGIAWDAPLPEVKRDDNAPVVDEDASEDELLAVFKWHVVYRGQKRLAKQLGVDESLVHRWLNRPPNVTHWIWDYTYCYLGGIGADDPIPHREEIGWAKSANQIWLRDPTGVEVAKRLQRKAS